jgi:site-specific recombinase XerC
MLMNAVLAELEASRDLSKGSIANYRRALQYFENYIGRASSIDDCTTQRVNAWLRSEQETRPNSYVLNLRRDLIVVWNYAAECEHCEFPRMRLIRRPRVERPSPEAWPIEWIPRLIEACEQLDSKIRMRAIKHSDYARAYLLTQLDMLCRPTDMRNLRWACIKGDRVEWVQNKTRVVHSSRLKPRTVAAIEQLRGLDEMFVFPLGKSATERMIRRIFVAAGIEKPKKQSLGHLRHTGGTAIADKSNVDAARSALGHLPDSRVFERHYLDRRKSKETDVVEWWEASPAEAGA